MNVSTTLDTARWSAPELAERGLLPDPVVRWGIRRLLRRRLSEVHAGGRMADEAFRTAMRHSPVALHAQAANDQHYEVPPAFFQTVLGPHLKYSSGLWEPHTRTLERAEAAMLSLTCARADLRDGQRVLELGCGWGSLSLWMARAYPNSTIVAVSNSAAQRSFIQARACASGLTNLEVITADMNGFEPDGSFDRVVSVEMFEHMRNWEQLIGRVATWLRPAGALFLHVFAHRAHCYPFEARSEDDWMARHFFTGGMMPSHDMLAKLDIPLERERSWVVSGTHYARTAEAWLANLDANRDGVRELFAATYGQADAERWVERWRMFFMSCAELFGYRGGKEWHVSHQRLRAPGPEQT